MKWLCVWLMVSMGCNAYKQMIIESPEAESQAQEASSPLKAEGLPGKLVLETSGMGGGEFFTKEAILKLDIDVVHVDGRQSWVVGAQNNGTFEYFYFTLCPLKGTGTCQTATSRTPMKVFQKLAPQAYEVRVKGCYQRTFKEHHSPKEWCSGEKAKQFFVSNT